MTNSTTHTDTEKTTFAIFDTSGQDTYGRPASFHLQYVANGEDAEDAFSIFADDVLSDTGEESGWEWHLYEIPADIADDDDAIYDYVSGLSHIRITS